MAEGVKAPDCRRERSSGHSFPTEKIMSHQTCTRCVMDTTHTEIQFDAQGVCSFCHNYDRLASAMLGPLPVREAKLRRTIDRIKRDNRKREYDCVLGVSGGVDSSFLAYKLREWGLRVLALQFDNGWNSELAVKNIEQLCRRLDIDLMTYVVDWEEFRDLQLAFLRASLANIEIPTDHAIIASLYKITTERKIRYLVSGVNVVTEGVASSSYGYSFGDLAHIRAIHRKFGGKKLRSFPVMGPIRKAYLEFTGQVVDFRPLDLIDYNKTEAVNILETQLGWKNYGGKHYESIITRFHQAFILPRKFGMDKRKLHYSNLICSGQISREDAVRAMAEPICNPQLLKQDYDYVIKKLDITVEEFERIMAAPPKHFSEYPNQYWLLKLIAKGYGVRSKIMRSRERSKG